jgi:hypothetical protein
MERPGFQFTTQRMLFAVLLFCIGAAVLGWGLRSMPMRPSDPQIADANVNRLLIASFTFVGMLGAAVGTLFGNSLRGVAVALILGICILIWLGSR